MASAAGNAARCENAGACRGDFTGLAIVRAVNAEQDYLFPSSVKLCEPPCVSLIGRRHEGPPDLYPNSHWQRRDRLDTCCGSCLQPAGIFLLSSLVDGPELSACGENSLGTEGEEVAGFGFWAGEEGAKETDLLVNIISVIGPYVYRKHLRLMSER